MEACFCWLKTYATAGGGIGFSLIEPSLVCNVLTALSLSKMPRLDINSGKE
jgi:hypothetical protein